MFIQPILFDRLSGGNVEGKALLHRASFIKTSCAKSAKMEGILNVI